MRAKNEQEQFSEAYQKIINEYDKDFDDEQRDQDPHRHEDNEGTVTAEDGLAAMDLFYKVLIGQSDAFVEMTEEQEVRYANLEALIRDEMVNPYFGAGP
jgi:hypothetical protein